MQKIQVWFIFFGGKCDWRRPWWCCNLDYTRFYHIVDHFPYSEGCTVGPQFNGSAAINFDVEGNSIPVTKVEKVLVKNVCVPLHDVIDARVATALRQRLYGGWSLYMA